MIKEYALGITNRHHFKDSSDVTKMDISSTDVYMSLWDYDEYVIEYYKEHNTLAGFDGIIYMPDEFILDIDGDSPAKAKNKTIALTFILDDLNIPYQAYFSGRGFHLHIPSNAFRWKPSKDLHLKVRDSLRNKGIFEYADMAVIDKTRLIRVPNTRNTKSNLWKIPLTKSELEGDEKIVLGLAYHSRNKFSYVEMECEPAFDVLKRQGLVVKKVTSNLGRDPDPVHYTCIQKMMKGVNRGSRHMVALRIAAHLRLRYSEKIVRMIMEDWRSNVDNLDSPFTKEEMNKIVENCYTGHQGDGYNYGCMDAIKDEFCDTTCFMYKSKKSSQSLMSATDMEKVLIDFYIKNTQPLDVGGLYNRNFPVYPGELVIVQGPPKSMKTMLLMNWLNAFKKRSYMMELEMSPRQIWQRFVMIEKGWNEDQLRDHYKQLRNGIDKGFEWLTVDYNSCYPFEIQKRISMLPQKPEVIVIDHIGLLRSRMRDNNMKVEEASQSLLELAVQNDIIVFAVSEITKQAFHEGLNLASAKGSFRVAYNANKVISINPYFDAKNKNLLKVLHVESTANREKEILDVKLNIDGVRIHE
jgi:hypothetical protein